MAGALIDQALDLTERLLPTLNQVFMGEYNREDTRETLERYHRDGVLIVRHYGLIGGAIARSPINKSHRIAVEGVFYAERGFRTLIKEFESWGVSRGAKAVALSCFSPRIGKIYQGLGYEHLENYFVKGI